MGYSEYRACENAHILNIRLPIESKIGEISFADSEHIEILLQGICIPLSLEIIFAEVGEKIISYSIFAGGKNLKEAHSRLIRERSIKDYAFDGCIPL